MCSISQDQSSATIIEGRAKDLTLGNSINEELDLIAKRTSVAFGLSKPLIRR